MKNLKDVKNLYKREDKAREQLKAMKHEVGCFEGKICSMTRKILDAMRLEYMDDYDNWGHKIQKDDTEILVDYPYDESPVDGRMYYNTIVWDIEFLFNEKKFAKYVEKLERKSVKKEKEEARIEKENQDIEERETYKRLKEKFKKIKDIGSS